MILKPEMIFLDDAEMKDLNHTVDLERQHWDHDQAVAFFVKHPIAYYDGKRWGFNDTIVREDICDILISERGPDGKTAN